MPYGRNFFNKENQDHPEETPRNNGQDSAAHLSDYHNGYTVEQFLIDLNTYFENEVDFNMTLIRRKVSQPGVLPGLIARAKLQNNHPVSEFIHDMLKASTDEKDSFL